MLKCTMIHSYPREYQDLYSEFRKGSTIRKWVNRVETMGSRILERNPKILQMELARVLPETWAMTFRGTYCVNGPEDKDAHRLLQSIGAVRTPHGWHLTPGQIAEYVERDVLNKFKGDMLEVFSEIFFTIFDSDEAIGISDYTPVDLDADYGVDATGQNVNGHQVAIQVKYRANPSDYITYGDIARTFTSAVCQMKMQDVMQHDHTVYLFTTAGAVTGAWQKVMGKKSVVITRGNIATKVDNNINFWGRAWEMIGSTIDVQ